MRPSDPHLRITIPIDFHPDSLRNDETVATAKGKAALAALWDVHTKLVQTAVQVQNKADLAKQVQPIASKAITTMRREVQGLLAQEKHHDEEVHRALGSGIGQLEQEIRRHCKELPKAERLQFAREVLASGNEQAIKALAAVPNFLSGLKPEEWSLVREQAEQTIAPRAYAERAAAQAAADRCQRAADDFDGTMSANLSRWLSSDDQKVKDLVASLTKKGSNDD
ncbi:MAG: hypothetical protein ACK5JT_20190 [Hyphomicrobiaceae bacterium]